MRKRIILAIIILAAIAGSAGAMAILSQNRAQPPPEPPPVSSTQSCIDAAAAEGMARANIALIPKAQTGRITSVETIRLREAMRRLDIPQCERLYEYLLRR